MSEQLGSVTCVCGEGVIAPEGMAPEAVFLKHPDCALHLIGTIERQLAALKAAVRAVKHYYIEGEGVNDGTD